jgi:hypothetical protein
MGRDWPNRFGPISAHCFSGFMPGPVIWAGPAHMFLIIFINIYIYIYIYLFKKFQKIPKILKKNYDFLKYFLPNLYNIRLYIYTIKYKSGIKILGFLRDISKKKFQNIFKKKLFSCIRPNPKNFPSMFSLKKKIWVENTWGVKLHDKVHPHILKI